MRAVPALSASITPGAARGWQAGARGVPDPAARARQAAVPAAQPVWQNYSLLKKSTRLFLLSFYLL